MRRAAIPSGIATIVVAGAALADVEVAADPVGIRATNVAPTEPGYQVLAEGLEDVHRAVGLGPGWTWRPSRFEGLGLGLLRIDAVFTRGLDPLTIATDCSRPGDHCLVRAELAVP